MLGLWVGTACRDWILAEAAIQIVAGLHTNDHALDPFSLISCCTLPRPATIRQVDRDEA